MHMIRLRILTLTLICFAMMGKSNAQVSDGYLIRWVERRAEQLNSQFETRPFESIGWAKDIRHATILAEKHKRPVFLFTLDGHMNTGRC